MNCNNPKIWEESCIQLIDTLKVVETGILNSKLNLRESQSVGFSSMMIAGFAFENAFKSWYLKNIGALFDDKGKLMACRDHKYIDWVKKHKFQLSKSENEALDKVQFFCVAWGRYPFHINLQLERNGESWGTVYTNQIRNIIERLLNGTMVLI